MPTIKTKGGKWHIKKKKVKGYVLTGTSLDKLMPATTSRIIKGSIIRSIYGDAVIFNKNKKTVGYARAEYKDGELHKLSYKGEVIAYRIK